MNERGYRVDITHASPDYELTVSTSRGTSVVLPVCFEQRPFTELLPGHVPFTNVESDGDWYPHGSDDVRRLSDTLTAHADGLRERRDPGQRTGRGHETAGQNHRATLTSVGPVGLEPTTNGLKVHCSAN